MPALKYKPGMQIGPNNLLLLDRRGQKGHFICPECKNENWWPVIYDVVKGKSTNCGCLRKKNAASHLPNTAKDITSYQFGRLTALRPTKKRQNTYIVWECLCKCGNKHYANVHDLLKGNVLSCGCLSSSKNEYLIKQWLEQKQIKYETQKIFDKCINPLTGYHLRFDFFLPDFNILIEYNGIQHYKNVEYFGGKQHLIETKQRDEIKKYFCENNNYKLFIIKYNDNLLEKLEELING